jgi:hypothetical protein
METFWLDRGRVTGLGCVSLTDFVGSDTSNDAQHSGKQTRYP